MFAGRGNSAATGYTLRPRSSALQISGASLNNWFDFADRRFTRLMSHLSESRT
jgi:hypothetical protein